MTESLQTVKLAVCLFDDVTILDFQGSMELIGFLAPQTIHRVSTLGEPKAAIEAVYLGPTAEPVRPGAGPLLVPGRTYDSVGAEEQFDILLIPGGDGTHPDVIPASLISFLKRQAPGAKYVLSVCTGSWALAQAGLLRGKRATTNKFGFNLIKDATKDLGIEWVAKARWVVDGTFWTASGVTAGIDMGDAFIRHFAGEEVAKNVRRLAEASVREQDDDEFAAFYGLV